MGRREKGSLWVHGQTEVVADLPVSANVYSIVKDGSIALERPPPGLAPLPGSHTASAGLAGSKDQTASLFAS